MLLICAAFQPELDPLLQTGFHRDAAAGVFWHSSGQVVAAALGVGGQAFSLGFAGLLARLPLKQAVFTGTCGVYPGREASYPPGSLVRATTACLGDLMVATGRGYLPAPVADEISLAEGFLPPIAASLPAARSLSLTAITADDDVAAVLADHYRTELEQLECHAFAAACQAGGIAGTTLLAVSNVVGRRGHAQWAACHERLAVKAAALLSAFLPA